MVAVRVVVFVVGALVVVATLGSSIRTVVLPRGVPARLARAVFVGLRVLFRVRIGRTASYERRDRIMALYGPLGLLTLLVAWLTLVLIGYMGMFWALGGRSLRVAFAMSGSSIFTLGFARPPDLPTTFLVVSEAAFGLVELALLITYMPSLYSAFSRREALVSSLEVRAGSPPSGVNMIERFSILGRLERLSDEVWVAWERWFVDVEESHTSFPALTFFRSPQPDHSWVTAAGAVLDAASLVRSTVDVPTDVQADICIRAGYLALRRICDFFRIPYDPDPSSDDPISITRADYDEVVERLEGTGVPLKRDRDQAWRDFAGWRVNYDTPLLALAVLTDAPSVPWSSDRALGQWQPRLFRTLARRD
jgi:hypothetical protein